MVGLNCRRETRSDRRNRSPMKYLLGFHVLATFRLAGPVKSIKNRVDWIVTVSFVDFQGKKTHTHTHYKEMAFDNNSKISFFTTPFVFINSPDELWVVDHVRPHPFFSKYPCNEFNENHKNFFVFPWNFQVSGGGGGAFNLGLFPASILFVAVAVVAVVVVVDVVVVVLHWKPRPARSPVELGRPTKLDGNVFRPEQNRTTTTKKKREHTKKNGNHGRVGNRRIGCRCLFSEWFSSGYFFFLFLFFFSFLLQPFPPGKSPAMAAVRCAATPTSPSSRLLFPRLLFCSRFAAGVITEFTAVARLSLVPTDSHSQNIRF